MQEAQQHKQRGGKRANAGRKATGSAKAARIDARVSVEQREKFERLGGAAWLRRAIDEAKEE